MGDSEPHGVQQCQRLTRILILFYNESNETGKEESPVNVSLTPDLEKMVQEKVASGLYNSASEVVREALRLLKEQDIMKQMRSEELRREVAIGIEQIERDEYTTYDSAQALADAVKAEGRRIRSRRSKKSGS
jgi:antitoxin ParD1/3/4